jgi:hypothetical protein
MPAPVLFAATASDAALVEKLAVSVAASGYDPVHEGSVLVGESLVEAASKLLMEGAPVVLCGTVRAMGTGWARKVANAARMHRNSRVFIVQMEEEADVETVSFDERIAHYWKDPAKATRTSSRRCKNIIRSTAKSVPPSLKPI